MLLISLAVVAAVAWLLAFGTAALGLWPGEPAAAGRVPGLAAALSAGQADVGEPPAVVSLVALDGQLDGRAYAATILDLAARGFLRPSTPRPGEMWLSATPDEPAAGDLTPYELSVLTQVRQRARGQGAPFQVLADLHAADITGAWEPFEHAVRSVARQAGLTRDFIPARARAILVAGLLAIGGLGWAGTDLLVHKNAGGGVFIVACVAIFVPLQYAKGRDRVTRAGSAMAAAAAEEVRRDPGPPILLTSPPSPADLRRLADALAIGAPLPLAISARPLTGAVAASRRPGRRRIRPPARPGNRPSAAWSSLTGQWRLVQIGPPPRPVPRATILMYVMICFFWVIFIVYIEALLTTVLPAGYLLPAYAVGAAIAAFFGVRGWQMLYPWLVRNRATDFYGQVIARWEETYTDGEGDRYTEWHIAVDDGGRGWDLVSRSGSFAGLELGHHVRARVLVQSGQMVALQPIMSDMIQPAP